MSKEGHQRYNFETEGGKPSKNTVSSSLCRTIVIVLALLCILLAAGLIVALIFLFAATPSCDTETSTGNTACSFLITNWSPNSIVQVTDGGDEHGIFSNVKEPHGIAYDPQQHLVFWTVCSYNESVNKNAIYKGDVMSTSGQYYTVTNQVICPLGIAVDYKRNFIVTSVANNILRMNYNGQSITTVATQSGQYVIGIALDLAAEIMYWADYDTDKIYSATYTGTVDVNRNTLLSSAQYPTALTLDSIGGILYWTSDHGAISRVRVDGTGQRALVAGVLNQAVNGLAICNKSLYFTDWNVTKALMKVPITGGTPIVVQSLASPFSLISIH